MEDQINDFIGLCNQVGKDESLVQGPGGNISVKLSGEEMVIKASGVHMKDISKESGYVHVNPKLIAKFFMQEHGGSLSVCEEEASKAYQNAILKQTSFRPSIETGFHAVLGRCVVHPHPFEVSILTCMVDGESVMKKIFPGKNFIWVKYKSPGYALTKEVMRGLEENKADITEDVVIFLENHGLIVSTGTIERGISLTREVCQEIFKYFKNLYPSIPAYEPDLLMRSPKGIISRNKYIKGYLQVVDRKENKTKFIFPDVIVYAENIFNKEGGSEIGKLNPDFSISYNLDEKKAKDVNEVINAHIQIVLAISKIGKVKYLSEDETEHIRNMAAEKYRRKLLKGEKE